MLGRDLPTTEKVGDFPDILGEYGYFTVQYTSLILNCNKVHHLLISRTSMKIIKFFI
jgi:hypothetical protein